MNDRELKREIDGTLTRVLHLGDRPTIDTAVTDGHVVVKGEVDHLSVKRLAIKAISIIPEVRDVDDQLRLATPAPHSDPELRRHVMDGLIEDPNVTESMIRVDARDGLVTLTGLVESLEEKRLAGLIAWWVPGVADVRNLIDVEPFQAGTEADLLDSVRQALEKDPFVNPDTIGVAVRDRVVTLVGTVGSEQERLLAEQDTYYLWGVEQVINQLAVRSPGE